MALYIVTSPNGIIDQDDSLPPSTSSTATAFVHADGTWSDVQTTHMVATVGYDERTDVIDQHGDYDVVDPADWRIDVLNDGGEIGEIVAVVGWGEYTYLVTIAWPINGGIRTYYLTTFDPLSPTT